MEFGKNNFGKKKV